MVAVGPSPGRTPISVPRNTPDETVEEVRRRERGLDPEPEVREKLHASYPPSQRPAGAGAARPSPFRKTAAQNSVSPAASASAGPQRKRALAAALTTTRSGSATTRPAPRTSAPNPTIAAVTARRPLIRTGGSGAPGPSHGPPERHEPDQDEQPSQDGREVGRAHPESRAEPVVASNDDGPGANGNVDDAGPEIAGVLHATRCAGQARCPVNTGREETRGDGVARRQSAKAPAFLMIGAHRSDLAPSGEPAAPRASRDSRARPRRPGPRTAA